MSKKKNKEDEPLLKNEEQEPLPEEKRLSPVMDFLFTYGWAILVVIVAVTALAYFGVLTPAQQCAGMRISDARILAEHSDCVAQGAVLGVATCNIDTKIISFNLSNTQLSEDCNPVCMVDVTTQQISFYPGCKIVIDNNNATTKPQPIGVPE